MRADLRRPLGPVIEKISPYEPAFLSEQPLDIILQGRYHKVPFLLGYNSREGMLIESTTSKATRLVTNFEEAIPFTLGVPKGSDLSLKIAKRVKEFYYGDKEPTLDDIDTLYKVSGSYEIEKEKIFHGSKYLFQLQTDNFFFRGIYVTAKLHADTSSEPVYFYKFSVDGPMNVLKKFFKVESPGE